MIIHLNKSVVCVEEIAAASRQSDSTYMGGDRFADSYWIVLSLRSGAIISIDCDSKEEQDNLFNLVSQAMGSI